MPQLLRRRNIAARRPWEVPTHQWSLLRVRIRNPLDALPGYGSITVDKIPPGPKLDALTAEKVFGWKNVHKHEGSLVGKKQDKAGRWRLAKMPYYSTNPLPCLFHRRSNEAAWTIGSVFKGTLLAYPCYKHSILLGDTGATLSCSNQSCGTVWPSHSVE